jgi:hypothetical protein
MFLKRPRFEAYTLVRMKGNYTLMRILEALRLNPLVSHEGQTAGSTPIKNPAAFTILCGQIQEEGQCWPAVALSVKKLLAYEKEVLVFSANGIETFRVLRYCSCRNTDG